MSGFEIELPSSPDPLGDESIVIPPASAAPPSTVKTRRPLQSAVSSRFSALPGTSPRKRMFALDVGDEITHQTIYVTVEAGPDGNPITRGGAGGSSVNRRLFGSPTPTASPHRGVRTTTTTIPLRGLTDDEADAMAVPRRRRRSSGRPDTPTAGPKKRKKGTPTPKATRKQRPTPVPSSDALQSETPAVLEAPTPRRRGRPPKRKVDNAPSEQDDDPNASQTAPRKRGRIRRQSLNPDEVDLLVAASNDDVELESNNSPAPRSPDALHDPISDPVSGGHGTANPDEDEEEDPFLAIPSDPPAVQNRSRQGGQSMEFSSDPAALQQYVHDPQVLEDRGTPPPESDDFAPMMEYDDRSDDGSQHSEPVPSSPVQHEHSEELEDHGLLPSESDGHAPMMDDDDAINAEYYQGRDSPRATRQVEHPTSELEDQGHLPGESDDYPPMDDDDKSDMESRHSETTPRAARQVGHQSSKLEDQGHLPGESDDYDHDDGNVVEYHQGGDTPKASRQIKHQTSKLEDQGHLPGESDDYAPMMDHDDRSDVESHHSGHTAQSEGGPDPTVDPETFTMIGIETMPSFHGDRGVPTSDLPEIGETTSLFINKTLDSLRQEMIASEEEDGEVDLLGSREQTPAEVEAETSAGATSFARHQGQPSKSPGNQSSRKISRNPMRLEPERPATATSSPWNRGQSSQSSLKQLSQNRLQSPKTSNLSPAPIASARSQRRVEFSVRAVRHQGAEELRSSLDELNADEDSFSDIPDDVLAAAEPREELQSPTEDELNWAVGVVKNMAGEKGYSHMSQSVDTQNHDPYSTTTSTPNRPSHSRTDDEAISQRSASRSAQSRGRSSQGTQQDDTASSSNHGTPADEHAHSTEAPVVSPDDIGSSPPEITTFDQVDDRQVSFSRRNSDTPANPPPSIHLQPVQERITYSAGFTTHAAGHRPGLSPIVRAGSRLQNILSDPPSPSGRSSVLGSPFKGSVKDSSPLEGPQGEDAAQNDASPSIASQTPPTQNAPQPAQPAAESPTKSWSMSLGPLGRIKNMVSHFTSPKVDASHPPEDPFGPSSPTRERPGSAFLHRIKQASHEGSVHSSRTSVARATVGDDDERDWAGAPAPRAPEMNTTADRAQTSGLFGSGLFRSRFQPAGLNKSYDGAVDEEPKAMFADRRSEQPQTDETEEQLVENEPHSDALRSEDAEPILGDAQSQQEDDEHRSYSDDIQVDDAPADDEQSDEEDIWAIEADRTASSPTAQKRANESINPFRKSGLSIDWGTRSTMSSQPDRSPGFKNSTRSAPQDQPDNLDDYSLLSLQSGDSSQTSAKKPTPEAQKQPKKADLSDFFSSSPNFIERERRAKEALFAKSAAQSSAANQVAHIASPQMTGETQNTTSSPSQNQLSSSSQPSPELQSPSPKAGQRTTQFAMSRASSSLTPEQPRRPQQRLAPRQAQNDAALFETWSVSSSRAPSERPRFTDPLSDARPSSPDAIERPSTPVERAGPNLAAPLLKPLPARVASPSKSCLRSPLKPKTPGRVVEFTSSTLSPTAEAQIRAEDQLRASTLPAPPSLLNSQRLPGQKDQPSSLATYTRPPPHDTHQQQKPQYDQEEAAESPLSQTRWSRRHWLYLDELLQAYRQSPRDFQSQYGGAGAIMTSPKERKSSSLLGKVVTSQGEEMVLEQWHLDVVDAFKDDVGGWPEEALAKRLFALIVGEERRRMGLVPSRR
ncbi:hypothetical protein VM1G_09299 [Cytospora mali]|uniref:Uncharacterized protein n=1 Tax=Cytospora mali TaxID=578113 RepID=A0A194WBL9_CYTMA|nr:hypothetical protein VM1G_09299 [Valsa mali]